MHQLSGDLVLKKMTDERFLCGNVLSEYRRGFTATAMMI